MILALSMCTVFYISIEPNCVVERWSVELWGRRSHAFSNILHHFSQSRLNLIQTENLRIIQHNWRIKHSLWILCLGFITLMLAVMFFYDHFLHQKACQRFSIFTKQHPLVNNTVTFFGLGISDTPQQWGLTNNYVKILHLLCVKWKTWFK